MKEHRPLSIRNGLVNRARGLQIATAIVLPMLLMLFSAARPVAAHDWFKTGTGLGVSKPRVAVADFAPRSTPSQPLANLFSEVVRNDLDYSGILDLASKSFYHTQVPSVPAELNAQAWSGAPVMAQFLAFGNLAANGNDLSIQAWFNDVNNASAPPVVGRVYHGDATEAQTRQFAHQFADEIIARLSGGVPGIASTQIAFVSQRSGSGSNRANWLDRKAALPARRRCAASC